MGVSDIASKTTREIKMEDPYQRLSCAIVEQAVTDYRTVISYLRQQLRHNRNPTAPTLWKVKELETFFNSEWCMLISPVEGPLIMHTILHEHDYSEVIKYLATHDENGNLIEDDDG